MNACKQQIDALTSRLTSEAGVGLSADARTALVARLGEAKGAYRQHHASLLIAQDALAAAQATLDGRTQAALRAFEAWHAASSTYTHPAGSPVRGHSRHRSGGLGLGLGAAGGTGTGAHHHHHRPASTGSIASASGGLGGLASSLTTTSPRTHAGGLSATTWMGSPSDFASASASGRASDVLDEAEAFDRLERERVAAADPDSLAYFAASKRLRQGANARRSVSPLRSTSPAPQASFSGTGTASGSMMGGGNGTGTGSGSLLSLSSSLSKGVKASPIRGAAGGTLAGTGTGMALFSSSAASSFRGTR